MKRRLPFNPDVLMTLQWRKTLAPHFSDVPELQEIKVGPERTAHASELEFGGWMAPAPSRQRCAVFETIKVTSSIDTTSQQRGKSSLDTPLGQRT